MLNNIIAIFVEVTAPGSDILMLRGILKVRPQSACRSI
jgi:hypothetical protein